MLVYVDGGGKYRVSHGGGAFEEAAAEAKKGFNVDVARDDDVHIISLQGPLALETLAPHTPMKLADLPYFKHAKTTIFGKQVSIARGGYSAERGYEVFCSAEDAPFIWDFIVAAGKDKGIKPVSWSCLDIIRVEGGLLFFPFDMIHGDTDFMGSARRLDDRYVQARLHRQESTGGKEGQGALVHHRS